MKAFSKPIAFLAALLDLRQRKLVPTALSTAELREINVAVRRKALFSARMTQLEPLQKLAEGLDDMLSGTGNLADAKLKLTETYTAMGYDAEAGGFKEDEPDTVPPARKGSLRDLASEKRMTLTITTNYRVAANQAYTTKGMTDVRRYQFPSWELVRIARRNVPRGFKSVKGQVQPKPGDSWAERWVAAGGELYDKGTRMIAAKDSAVWQALGDGLGSYKDTLGNPFPPFAFGSGFGIREVRREECLLLGVIQPDETIAQMTPRLEGSLKAEAKGFNPALLAAMKDLKRDGAAVRLQRSFDADLAAADAAYKAKQASLKNKASISAVMMNMGTSAGAIKGWLTRRKKTTARKGVDAMRRSVQGQKDVEAAMRIPGLGTIDFDWGTRGRRAKDEQGATHTDGWGIHHIWDKRGDRVVAALPIILARGKVSLHDREAHKRYVKYAGWTAVIKQKSKGQWNVTTLIDDDIKPRKPLKNQTAQLSNESRAVKDTTQMSGKPDHSHPTHTSQLFAEADAGAAKAASMRRLHVRCKRLLDHVQRRAAA